ncbi:RAD protein [Plasmodium cynomolgi strain B]|uniref:RAD protein n=1 Tax=Plasmodium cynomolgi (strain B) TaxID=1120755 RepID=K6UIS6_PLACD|nr:RAD protein [Plasmodium cynomolgi strain B]GAB65283.1 RAD protein [Plasmodium cynomolgi strain B]
MARMYSSKRFLMLVGYTTLLFVLWIGILSGFLLTMKYAQIGNKSLTPREVNNLLDSLGVLVSKRKAKFVFYHYNRCLRKMYNDMMDRLWVQFATAATKRGMSRSYQMRFWKECDDEITNDFVERDEYFLGRFRKLISKGTMMSLTFFTFMCKYNKSWKAALRYYEDKWSITLWRNVESYPGIKVRSHGNPDF